MKNLEVEADKANKHLEDSLLPKQTENSEDSAGAESEPPSSKDEEADAVDEDAKKDK
jgi:hypothetical protein